MAVTDADRLAAAGAELEIAGHAFRVRYTPRAMKALEDDYGSIFRVMEQLQGMSPIAVKVLANPAPTISSFAVDWLKNDEGSTVVAASRLIIGQEIALALERVRIRAVDGNLVTVYPELQVPPLPGEQITSGGTGMVGTLWHILSLGLLNQSLGDGTKIDEGWLLDNGDMADYAKYTEQALTALVEAFPSPGGSGEVDPTKATQTGQSNGVSTTGSRSPSRASSRGSSGTG